MQEKAKCPLSRQEPTLRYWDNDEDPSYIYCCGAMLASIELWNRYAAAMELAELLAWQEEVEEFISNVQFEGKTIKGSDLVKILNQAEYLIYAAEFRVRELFKRL